MKTLSKYFIKEFKYYIPMFESKDIKMEIPEDVMQVYDAFKRNGKQLYVVGGAVRDAVMGNIPHDWDLATNAKPEESIAIANKEGLKHTEEVGERFGIVIINGHEVATFRQDKGKGRRPDSVSYTDIEGDVMRRDLTVNALFYDIEKQEVVDMVGGIDDLHKNQIRSVGEPKLRFEEDPLRKLRAVRFIGKLNNGRIEEKTYTALQEDPDISMINSDSIYKEFMKGIIESRSTKQYLDVADKLGMLEQILPGFNLKRPFIDENDPIIMLAYLTQEMDGDTVERMLMNLKYSNDQAYGVKFLLSLLHFAPEQVFKHHTNYVRSKLSPEQVIRWGELIGKDLSKFVEYKPSVSGKDAPSELKGKAVGDWKDNEETKKYNSMFEKLIPMFEDFKGDEELTNLWNIYMEFIEGIDGKISETGELESKYWKEEVEPELNRITRTVKTLSDVSSESEEIIQNLKDLLDGLDGLISEQGNSIENFWETGVIRKARLLISN